MTTEKDDDKIIKDKVLDQLASLKDADTEELSDSGSEIPQFKVLWSEIDDQVEIKTGTVLGHWTVIEAIGQGGMSSVYLVERNDGQLQQKAALKVIPSGMMSENLKNRFLRERQILSDLNHPNIAKLYDAGITPNGIPWYVMEYVDGHEIIEYMEQNKLNMEQKISLVLEVCRALGFAHSKGVVHRDIKNSNILVNNEGQIKLLDFGIATLNEQQSLTMTGAIIGTPGYMSPEQARGQNQDIDRRSDVFSVGILLYRMLNQKMPFEASSVSEVSYKILHDDPQLINKQVPADIRAIVEKCLQKERESRYQSCKQLQEDLQAYLHGDVVSAKPSGLIERLFKKARKHPRLSFAFGFAFLTIIASLIYAVYQSYESLQKIRLAEKFLSTSQEIKSEVRRVHMMPLHDVKSEYAEIENKIAQLKDDVESSQADQSGLTDFALGSALMTMRKFPEALEYFQSAYNKGYRTPELLSSLGYCHAIAWSSDLLVSKGMADEVEKESLLTKSKTEHFNKAVEFLNQTQDIVREGHFLAGKLAYINKDYDLALDHYIKEAKANPWHYEALRAASEVNLFLFKTEGGKIGYDQAVNYLDESNRLLESSINIGRSDPWNYLSRCTNASVDVQIKRYLGLEDQIQQAYEKGMNFCQNALSLRPESYSPIASQMIILQTYAGHLQAQGESIKHIHEQTVQLAETGLQQHPQNDELLNSELASLIWLAQNSETNQADEYFSKAMAVSDASIDKNIDHPKSWNERGVLYVAYGEYLLSQNAPSEQVMEPFQIAADAFAKKIELEPGIDVTVLQAKNEQRMAQLLVNKDRDNALDMMQQSLNRRQGQIPDSPAYFHYYLELLNDYQLFLGYDLKQQQYQNAVNNLQNNIDVVCQIKPRQNSQRVQLQNFLDHLTINQVSTPESCQALQE